MRIGELKVIHIIILVGLLLWAYLFYDSQMTKYQLQFTNWQGQVVQAINNIGQRIDRIEGVNRPPIDQPKNKKKGEKE